MRAGGEHATAEQERLTLYLLGALDDAEREAFEEHLAGCWECLEESARIGPSIGGLAGLGEADWLPPTTDPPAPSSTPAVAPSSTPASSTPAVTPVTEPATAERPDDVAVARPVETTDDVAATRLPETTDGVAGSVRPAATRPPGRPAAGTRPGSAGGARRRRRFVWATAAAFVALALAGGVVAVNQWNAGSEPVLTASGAAPGYGASLSVAIVTGDEGRSTIRITVSGLRPGIQYRLFAVTRDGATYVVRDWTASAGPHEVAGETSLPVEELSFITVGLIDGSAVVTAPLAQDPATPR